MRYYLIGEETTSKEKYDYAESWLKLYNNTVINPNKIKIDGIEQDEMTQIKIRLLAFSDGVVVLERDCSKYEIDYAKQLGKKIKYLPKNWNVRKIESNEIYKKEKMRGIEK